MRCILLTVQYNDIFQEKKKDNSSFDDSAFEALEKDFQEVSFSFNVSTR